MGIQQAKQAAGKFAAMLIEPGMIVGLGTGSTAVCFIEALIERVRGGLKIQAVASSAASHALAAKGGIPMLDLNTAPPIDLTVDGADEIDPQKRMIKGGGGAHVREKILAAAAREMVVVVDETKRVSALGKAKLSVEVLPFGSAVTQAKIEKAGYVGQWRQGKNGSLFLTENGNFLFDIQLPAPCSKPEEHHERLLYIPGVVDTGFFFHLAGRVVVGFSDGHTELWI